MVAVVIPDVIVHRSGHRNALCESVGAQKPGELAVREGVWTLVIIAAIACGGQKTPLVSASNGEAPPSSPNAALPRGAPEAGIWPLPGRDPEGTRYSPLTEITPDNV